MEWEKENNIDDILEQKWSRGADKNEERFNSIDNDFWEEEYRDLYEYYIGHEN